MSNEIRTTGLIATRNQKLFIKDAMQSLAAEVDELLVVDDSSCADAREVLEANLPANGRLLINNLRLGVSSSFNKGVSAARGQIILIQGGDDVTLPGRAESHLSALEDPNAILSYSHPVVIGETGGQLPVDAAPEFLIPAPMNRLACLDSLFRGGNFVCAPSAAFRKADYVKFGGFSSGVKFLQDFGLWLKFAAEGDFVLSPVPGVKYRKHGNNLSREGSQDSGVNRMRFEAEYDFLIEKFLEGLSTTSLRGLVEESGRQFSSDDEINRALLGITHPDQKVRRRAVARILALLDDPARESELRERALGAESLDALSAAADHSNLQRQEFLKRQYELPAVKFSQRGAK